MYATKCLKYQVSNGKPSDLKDNINKKNPKKKPPWPAFSSPSQSRPWLPLCRHPDFFWDVYASMHIKNFQKTIHFALVYLPVTHIHIYAQGGKKGGPILIFGGDTSHIFS